MTKEIIERFYDKKSILGVCLGHQAIGEVFGAKLFNLNQTIYLDFLMLFFELLIPFFLIFLISISK